MESESLAGLFKPPAPYSLDGHFNVVTKDKATAQVFGRLRQAYHFDLDAVLALIKARPTENERAALMIVLAVRLEDYGKARGFLDETKGKAPKGSVFADFILQDVIGLSPDTVPTKIASELKTLLTQHANENMNARGKAALKYMKWVHSVIDAANPHDRWRALLAISNEKISSLLTKYSPGLMKAALKKTTLNQAARNRVLRIIALRVAWIGAWGARCAKLSPIVFALDLLLTPSELASDAEEEKLGFLALYTRVAADRRILLTNIIERAPGPQWKFTIDPGLAIRAAM